MRKKRRTRGRIKRFEQGAEQKDAAQYREERKKTDRPRKRVKYNRTRMALTVIVTVLIAVVGVSVKNIFSLRMEQKELQAANSQLTAEKASLKDELKNVNDEEYIEEQARIQLKLIKPGEVLYILNENQDSSDGED